MPEEPRDQHADQHQKWRCQCDECVLHYLLLAKVVLAIVVKIKGFYHGASP
jgi:hypothetical protein